MKVLSLDVSTQSTGYAIISNGLVKDFGTIKFKNDDFLVRGNYMAEFIRLLREKYGKFDKVVIEELKVGKNHSSSVKLAIVQGLILRELSDCEATFYGPTVWRKHFNLNGKREEAKAKAISKAKRLGYDVQNDDEAEAILLGLFFISVTA